MKRRFEVDGERSALLVEARSSVGPITFGTQALCGQLALSVQDGAIDTAADPSARVEVDVASLRSGNAVYDAELLRRVDARRFPTATAVLTGAAALPDAGRYLVEGDVTFHGVTRHLRGVVEVATGPSGEVVVEGDQAIDMRDFALAVPALLMLTIYPDVRVRLRLVAKAAGVDG